MSDAKHTPGPWFLEELDSGDFDVKTDKWEIATAWGGMPATEANAHRIVAAVNACEGITTEALGAGAVAGLLEALKYWQDAYLHNEDPDVAFDLARAAIAKAEGKA